MPCRDHSATRHAARYGPRMSGVPRIGDRSLFPDIEARVYANHAAISPFSSPVREAIAEVAGRYGRDGVGNFPHYMRQREDLRARLGQWVGGAAEDIAFVPNTTAGVIAVAQSLRWRAGDRVILFEGEFPANVTPWQRAAAQFELELVWVPIAPFARSVDEGIAALDDALDGGARLVAVSAVQFQTGLRMPLARMAERAHRAGAELFVDAIQAVGSAPLDAVALGIDYLSVGGHKWMMGAEGAGFAYFAPHTRDALEPRLAGWLSHDEATRFLTEGPGHLRVDRGFVTSASMLEPGTPNVLGYAALGASLGLLEQLDLRAVHVHVQRWHDALEPALAERGFVSLRAEDEGSRSSLLCFTPPDTPFPIREWPSRLSAEGVAAALPDGNLRFSPHWPNGLDEPGLIAAAVDRILA